MESELIHIISALSALVGTWLLAFALRIKEGVDPKFRKELRHSVEGKIAPADVAQRLVLFWVGLALITLGILLEIGTTIFA